MQQGRPRGNVYTCQRQPPHIQARRPYPHVLAIYHSWNLIDDSVRYILCCRLSKACTLTAMRRAVLLML